MSATKVLLLCALSTVCLCLVGARGELVIVCPDDYSPSPDEDCVPLHQLVSTLHLIHSNTTIQFLPAVFKLGPDLSISIANVSNITVGAAGPHRATISCTGSNSGFVFKNVSGLTVQNMNITACAAFIFDGHLLQKNSIAISECMNITLSNMKFTASGVYVGNICGYFTTSNALFTEMANSTGITLVGRIGSLFEQNCPKGSILTITNSEFLNSHCGVEACAVSIESVWPTILNLSDVAVKNNTIGHSLLHFDSHYSTQQTMTLEKFRLEENKLTGNRDSLNSNAIEMIIEKIPPSGTAIFKVTDSVFANNEINGIVVKGATELLIKNTVFFNNKGSAVQIFMLQSLQYYNIEFSQSSFINNTSTDHDFIVSLRSNRPTLIYNCTFSSNSGTSLIIYDSVVEFSGMNLFSNNTAQSGAAILLVTSLIEIYDENTTLYIQGNVAEKYGGGIFVFVQKFSADANMGNCFLQTVQSKKSNIVVYFDNNTAQLAGNDIYGGNLYSCNAYHSFSFQFLLETLHSPAGYKMDVSSLPYRVCECSPQNIQTCVHPKQVIGTIETYPGKTFNLSLLIVGQVLNISLLSGVPSAVYADVLPQTSTGLQSGSIPDEMLVQKVSRTPSNASYSINSTRDDEVLVLMAVDASKEEISQYWQSYPSEEAILTSYNKKYSNVPSYIQVHFIPCPAGFALSTDGACICSSALKNFKVECIIDTLMIRRKSSYFWLAFNISFHFSDKFLVHEHCPFDYCNDVVELGLEDTDALCSHNRSGILCGACRSGYSLILGGTECRQCSNIYLLLLLPFALAGILLVVFLFLTDMTVAAGTINGLLFYANIVTDNKATFFPPGAEDSFLSVFVQWLSLNVGLKSCYFDGLDAYIFTWLQLVFPIYICLLAFTIIVASRYITWMNRLCGSNTVHVLATLFLLSYTKVQATIASGLSFTVVEVSDGEKLFVWLKDGNVPYLQGKHIALFMVSLLLLCIFSLYTLSIALGPWLQRKTQYKVLCWVLKLKPLFDAYFGPLKCQYRYWTGLLLLSRTILYLVSSVNVLGDDSVDLLAIAILCLLLTWLSRSVYKHRVLSALDSFFLINLCVLALVSLYNKLSSGGSQTVTIYVSSGSAFAVFCVILLYHCTDRLKKVIYKTHNAALRNELSEDSDDEMLLAVDADRD